MLSQDWHRVQLARIRLRLDETCCQSTLSDGEFDREVVVEALMDRESEAVLAFAGEPIGAKHDFSARIAELMHICRTEYEPGPWEEGRCALLAAVRADLHELARRLAHRATPEQIKRLRNDAVELTGWEHDWTAVDFDEMTRRLLHLCVDVHHDIQTISDQYRPLCPSA